MVTSDASAARRRFLKLLATSPLVSFAGLPAGFMDSILRSRGVNVDQAGGAQDASAVIAAVQDALDIFDLEAVAKKNLLPAHWAYLSTSVDDDSMVQVNRDGFARYQVRMRPLGDFSKLDMSVTVFGTKWNTPIVLCPVSGLTGFHSEGEKGAARAAKTKGHLLVLSNWTSTTVEAVTAARGEPIWFQLFARDQWDESLKIVKRAEAAGCPALVWTVDLLGGSNRETNRRGSGREGVRAPLCKNCHDSDISCKPCHEGRVRPMSVGLSANAWGEGATGSVLSWDGVKRIKDTTKMKLLLKGIQTREDAEQAIALGADGIWVSNHGGRAGNSGRSTLESLPEIVAGVARRVPIIFDSGIRRGNDIFKALALGATAVGIGRAYVYGLAAFGQEGVEAALDILRRELQMVMRQTGTLSPARASRASLVDRFAAAPGAVAAPPRPVAKPGQ